MTQAYLAKTCDIHDLDAGTIEANSCEYTQGLGEHVRTHINMWDPMSTLCHYVNDCQCMSCRVNIYSKIFQRVIQRLTSIYTVYTSYT